MATNTGFLLMAGLGALLFLGRGATATTADEDNRLLPGTVGGGPTTAAFDLQSYIDSLFTMVPVQPPLKLIYPRNVVVTSSGVPGITKSSPGIITGSTKVQIGGDGGRTITASALAVLRSEQLAKQRFDAAANVQPSTWPASVEANKIEEERQRQFARDLIAKNIAAQLKRNQAVIDRTRLQQENIVRGLNPDGSAKTLGRGMSVIVAGQPIVIADDSGDIGVDFTPQYTETFIISGGMASPGFASEDEQPSQSATTVHELTASYLIGF